MGTKLGNKSWKMFYGSKRLMMVRSMTVIKKLLALDCLMVGAVLQRLVWHAHPV